MNGRNWSVLLIRLMIFAIALAILGGIVWFVAGRGDDAPQVAQGPQTSSTNTDKKSDKKSDDKQDDEEEALIDDLVGRDEDEEDDGSDDDDRAADKRPRVASDQLPATGPADLAAGALTLPLAGAGAYRLAQSRRAFKNAHRR